MDEVRTARLRTLRWVIAPVTVVIFIPLGLLRLAGHVLPEAWGLWQWIGAWLILEGLGLAAWCVNLFNVQGRGTPLPWDPPKQFVVSGPYRVVRNPMMLGLFLILGGEALLCQSWWLAGYLAIFMLIAHLFVRSWEEPQLVTRFGEAYRAYQQQVPRWLPRLPTLRRP